MVESSAAPATDFCIREATEDDAEGFNAVYNPYIMESAATFETQPYDAEQRRRLLSLQLADPRRPVFVATEGSRVLGFAGAARFDERAAYETSVKTSVFLAPDAQGRSIAKALYARLFERLGREDVHRAYALIVLPNPASIGLHDAFGFRRVAVLNEVGRKFGQYYDVAWYEKRI